MVKHNKTRSVHGSRTARDSLRFVPRKRAYSLLVVLCLTSREEQHQAEEMVEVSCLREGRLLALARAGRQSRRRLVEGESDEGKVDEVQT